MCCNYNQQEYTCQICIFQMSQYGKNILHRYINTPPPFFKYICIQNTAEEQNTREWKTIVYLTFYISCSVYSRWVQFTVDEFRKVPVPPSLHSNRWTGSQVSWLNSQHLSLSRSSDHCFAISIAWQLLRLNYQYLFFEEWHCSDILEQLSSKCFPSFCVVTSWFHAVMMS